jgi:cobalt-zinc-cadmium efflux system membrane fusion protein
MKHSTLFAALVAAACLLEPGCKGPQPASAGAPDLSPDQTSLFRVPPEQLAHLKISPVTAANWSVVVRTTGTVDWNTDRTTPAITQIGGPVVRILVNTGDLVGVGQPLLYVTSPDVAGAISTYRKARNRQNLTQRILERTADLVKNGAAAPKDLESAQSDVDDAATDVQTSLQALKIFGVTKAEIDEAERAGTPINPELAVRAPIAGVVVQKLVAPGLLLQAGATTCFVISDLSTVWVQGHIFDRDLPSIRVGDTVEETNVSIPGTFHGVVEYIGSMMDPATRTTPVRIVTRNPGGLLKKDMFVEAIVHTRSRRNVLVAPASAVLHDAQNEPFVYLQAQSGHFAQRVVTVGGQQDGQVEILSGLKAGDPVVSEGSLFLQFINDSR